MQHQRMDRHVIKDVEVLFRMATGGERWRTPLRLYGEAFEVEKEEESTSLQSLHFCGKVARNLTG